MNKIREWVGGTGNLGEIVQIKSLKDSTARYISRLQWKFRPLTMMGIVWKRRY